MHTIATLLLAGLTFASPSPSPARDEQFAAILKHEDTRSGGAPLRAFLDVSMPLDLRVRATLAFGRIGSPGTTPYDLLGPLSDREPTLRRMAAFALGEMDDLKAAPLLAASLGDADETVRALAAEALGKLKDPGSALPLMTALDDASDEVVGHALLALWKIDPGDQITAQVTKAAAIYRRAKGDLRGRAVYFLMRAMIAHPQDAAIEAALLSTTADADALTRSWTARGLSGSLSPLSTRALLVLATDRDPQVRINAFNALKTRPVMGGCGVHLSVLADKNRGVALAALAALENCEGEESSAALVRSLASPHSRFREVAAIAIAAHAKAGALPLLISLAGDAIWSVRARAAEALVAAGGVAAEQGEARAALARLLADSDPRVRLAAVEAATKGESEPAGAARRTALEDADPYVRAVALEAVGANLPTQAAARAAQVEVLAAGLSRALTDQPNDARLAALAALARVGGDAAKAAIETALTDRDYLVRRRAAELLRETFRLDRFAAVASPPASRDDAGYLAAVRRGHRRVTATIETAAGTIDLELFAADAPLTVDNFIKLAREGRMDNLTFHRVVPNFVVQDGDPRGDGNGGPPWQIRCEINPRRYGVGAVGMALSGKDTGGSQYFITHSPQPHLDGGYTVFGQVLTGQEIVDTIVQGDAVRRVIIHEPGA